MNRIVFLFAVVLIAAIAGPKTWAASVNLSTGLDASNSLITSGGVAGAHWTVSEQAGGTGQAQTVFPNDADWYGGWIANGPSSDWIARNANITDNGPAPYSFTLNFTLTASELSSAAISGSWTIDDGGTLSLNGHQIGGSLSSGDWSSLHAFSVGTGSSDFVAGLNTLTITITESDNYLEGVRLQGFLTYNAVPEPSTIVMGSMALLIGVGLIGRRRKSHSAP